jgi:imidazolonepropionase-like amidohydrolase
MAWVTAPETLVVLRSVADLQKLLKSGFTCVREMGSKGGAYLARAIREGVIDGPDLLSCARSLGQTGGDDDPTILPLHIAQELSYSYFGDGPWECRKAVRKVVRDGADFVKVYAATGSTLEPFTAPWFHLRPQLNAEELKAIVDEAHSAGLKVAGHAIGEDSLRNVVEAGVDSIEYGMALTPSWKAFFAWFQVSSYNLTITITRRNSRREYITSTIRKMRVANTPDIGPSARTLFEYRTKIEPLS